MSRASSIISFPSSRFCLGGFRSKWGAITTQLGHGFDAKWGTVPDELGQPRIECPIENRSEQLGWRWFGGSGVGRGQRACGLQPPLFHFLHSAPYMVPVAGWNLGLADFLD